MNKLSVLLLSTLMFSGMIVAQTNTQKDPIIMAYWANWDIYSNTLGKRAVPEPPYAIPGSVATDGSTVINQDLSDKLNKLDILAYSFLRIQPKTIKGQANPHIGTLYFSDPNSDIRKNGIPNHPDNFCDKNTIICNYTQNISLFGKGNFQAFTYINNQAGTLKKIISIGGDYNHAFVDTFFSRKGTRNFVNSAATIIRNYSLDGIDLDYELKATTPKIAKKYTHLIKELRNKLGDKSLITVTILANPCWIRTIGTKNWRTINKNADYINLMTYDFHGSFDYDDVRKTGFLTSLYNNPHSPYGKREFSIDKAVKALIQAGIPNKKIVIGVPAYGRALQNVGTKNNGLFQAFNTPIPVGNIDGAFKGKWCSTALPRQKHSCSGAFLYRYIIKHMLKQGFTEHEGHQHDVSNSVWAYAPGLWQVYGADLNLPKTAKTLNNTFISYANTHTVAAEADYVNANYLGGMMLWEIRGDMPADDPASLLSTMYRKLG